jgi:homoserine dehydrogenase
VLSAWVAPVEVDASSLFGRTTGPRNAAVITGVHSGEIGIFGVGAGGDATAVALLGDIAAIARDKAAILPAPILNSKFTILNSALREAV